MTVRIGQSGMSRGAPGAKREMESNAQRGMARRDADSFRHGRFIDHEAGLRQEPGALRALNGGIDFRAAAEVVGGEDELFQNAGGARILRVASMPARPIRFA